MKNALIIISTLFLLGSGMLSCTSSDSKTKSENTQNMKIKTYQAFIGTYTKFATNGLEKSKGIYSIFTDQETGAISLDTLCIEINNPSFLAFSTDKKFLFASADRDGEDEIRGQIHSFKIHDDRTLSLISTQSSLGNSACHVAIDQNNQFAFVANYSTGNASVFNILDNGELSEPIHEFNYEGSGPHKNQKSAHPHQTTISPDNKFAYIPDLGVDKIHAYKIVSDENKIVPAEIEDITLPPGSGPRHMTFHPNGKFAYVINELASTIQAFEYNAETGFLKKIALYSTLPDGYEEDSYCADIHIDQSGQFLYGSNRGHNSLVTFKINSDGSLINLGHHSVEGNWPRNFSISPDNRFIYVANRKTGNITILKRDLESGTLSLVDADFLSINEPVCVLFSE